MAKRKDSAPEEPSRHQKPISLHPLTVEEALRRAMNAKPPEREPDGQKQKAKPPADK